MNTDEIARIARRFRNNAHLSKSSNEPITVDDYNKLVEEIYRAIKKLQEAFD